MFFFADWVEACPTHQLVSPTSGERFAPTSRRKSWRDNPMPPRQFSTLMMEGVWSQPSLFLKAVLLLPWICFCCWWFFPWIWDPMEVSKSPPWHMRENICFWSKIPGPIFFSKIQVKKAVLKAALFGGWHLGRGWQLFLRLVPLFGRFRTLNGLVLKSGDGWEGWICFFLEVVKERQCIWWYVWCAECFYKYYIYHVLYCLYNYIYIYLIYIEFKRNARSVLSKTLYIGWHASGEFVVRTLNYGFEKWCMVS